MKATNFGLAIVFAAAVFLTNPGIILAQVQSTGQNFTSVLNFTPEDVLTPQVNYDSFNQINGLGLNFSNLITDSAPAPIDNDKLLYTQTPPLVQSGPATITNDQPTVLPKIKLDGQGDISAPNTSDDKIQVDTDAALKLQQNQDRFDSSLAGVGVKVAHLETQVSAEIASQEAEIEQLKEQVAENTAGISDLKQSINNMINMEATSSGQTKPYFSGPMIPADSLVSSDSAKPSELKGSENVLGSEFEGIEATPSGDLLAEDGFTSVRTTADVINIPQLKPAGQQNVGSVNFFGGLVSIDNSGEIVAKSISTDQIKLKANKSEGQITLAKGKTEIVVPNQLVQASSVIFVTPDIPLSQVAAAVNKIPGKSFTIRVLQPELTDVDFSYVIIGITP